MNFQGGDIMANSNFHTANSSEIAACPVCMAEHEAEDRFFRWYRIETYNSPAFLDRMAFSGFCPWHALRIYDPEWHREISSTYRPLFGAYTHQLDKLLPILRRIATEQRHPTEESGKLLRIIRICIARLKEKSDRRLLLTLARINDPCPVCEARSSSASYALLALNDTLRKNPDQTPILCRPHLWQAIKEMPTEITARLVEHTLTAATAIETGLEEFWRKSAWCNRDEPKGDEQFAWMQAMHFYDSLASVIRSPTDPSKDASINTMDHPSSAKP